MVTEPLGVAPTDVDGERNVLRAPLQAFASWQLEDAHFAFDSSVLLPSMTPELASLIGLVRASPGAKLGVFGHTDTTGNDEYNKVLSGRRALALFALLTRRVDVWESLFMQPHGGDDWRRDKDFSLRLMRGSVGDDKAALSRAALFEKFMTTLARDPSGAAFGLPKTSFLGQGRDAKGKGDVQGCGEFNPLLIFSAEETRRFAAPSLKAERDELQGENRRVTVLLFPADTEIDVTTWPCPRALEPTTGCRKRFWSDHVTRRTPGAGRREQPADEETFACRFYDRLARETRSPQQLEVLLTKATRVGTSVPVVRGSETERAPIADVRLRAASRASRVEIEPLRRRTVDDEEMLDFDLQKARGLISFDARAERDTIGQTAPVGVDLIGLLGLGSAAELVRRTLGYLQVPADAPTPLDAPEPVTLEFEDLQRPFENPIVPEGEPPGGLHPPHV